MVCSLCCLWFVQVDDAMGVVTSLKFELIATKDTLDAKEKECATLKEARSLEQSKSVDEMHAKDVLIGDLQHRADALRSQLELSQTALESAQAMRNDVQSRLEDAMRDLQRERDANQGVLVSERTLQSKVQQLHSQMEDLNAKLKASEVAKATEQRHAITEKHKVAAVEAEASRLQEELALVRTQAKSLSAQLQDQQSVLVDVRRRHRDELTGLEKLLEEERQRVRECEAELDKAASEAVQRGLQTKSAAADAESKQIIIQELEQRLSAMRQDLEKGAKRIMSLDKQKAEADGKIAALTDRVASNEKELQAARSELQQAHHKTHKCETVITMLRSEVDGLKKASAAATKGRTEMEVGLLQHQFV
jgi:chromosome segregation ATPase